MARYDCRLFDPDVHGDCYAALHRDAGEWFRDLTSHERLVLAMDAYAVLEELRELLCYEPGGCCSHPDEAVRTLRERLGGWKNLASYSRCLMVQEPD